MFGEYLVLLKMLSQTLFPFILALVPPSPVYRTCTLVFLILIETQRSQKHNNFGSSMETHTDTPLMLLYYFPREQCPSECFCILPDKGASLNHSRA